MGVRLDPNKSDREYEREHDLRMHDMRERERNIRYTGGPRRSGCGWKIFLMVVLFLLYTLYSDGYLKF